jgi:hypothetical protein
MTIKKLMLTGAAALAVVGALSPAAAAAPPGDGLSGVLHDVGATLDTGDDQSRLGNSVLPQPPVSTDLTSRVGDGLKAMSEELLR